MNDLDRLIGYMQIAYKDIPHKIYFDGKVYKFEMDEYRCEHSDISSLANEVMRILLPTPKEIYPERYIKICENFSIYMPFELMPSFSELKLAKVKVCEESELGTSTIKDYIKNVKYNVHRYPIEKDEIVDYTEYAYYRSIYVDRDTETIFITGIKHVDILLEQV